jgi:hypothetical protein
MSELIGIREAARRLGVSDTAVHKAIKVGRASIAGWHPTSGRRLVSWPEVEQDWHANSDASKRTHVGPQGGSTSRERYKGNVVPAKPLPTANMDVEGPSLAQSRALREGYMAQLAKLEYEHEIGKVIDADEVKREAFRAARQVRDSLLNLPDRLAAELAAESNQFKVHQRLVKEIRRALEELKLQ